MGQGLRRIRGWLAPFVILIILLIPGWATAETMTIAAEPDRIDLAQAFQTLERARADDTADIPPDDFPASDGRLEIRGYSDTVLWGRTVLRNPSAQPLDRVLQIDPARLQSVRLFLRDGTGPWQPQDSGSRMPWHLRPMTATTLAFPVHLAPGATLEVVVRAESETLLALYPTLWSPAAFQRWSLERNLVLAMSWGAAAALGIFALALALLHRDLMQLIMGSRLAVVLLRDLALFGIASVFLWPDAPDWDLRAPTVLSGVALTLTSTFILLFVPSHHCSRPVWRILAVAAAIEIGLTVACAADGPFGIITQALLIMVVVSVCCGIWICATAIRTGYRPARHLLPAFIIGTISTVVRNAEAIGLLNENGIGLMMPTLLSVLSHVMFLTAAAERTNVLRREKAEAQAQLLALTTDAQARLEREIDIRTCELRIAVERAESASRDKTQFLAQVSHELRTPLHTILGYTELMRGEAWGRRIGERLSVIAEGGRHLLRLIEDLLSFARGEYNTEKLRPEPIYLHQFIRRVGEQGMLLARRQGNRFHFDATDPGLPAAIAVDVRRLEQVLLILLSNAANATRNGNIALTLAAAAAADGRVNLTIAVSDSGPGIDAADQERIFEPFERGARSSHDGLGLGLAIGRQIISRMEGRLMLESRPDVGSRFWFTIPVPEADESLIHVPATLPGMVGYAGETRTVLVVDDTVPHRRLIEEILSDLGFTVTGAGSVAECRRAIATHTYDLAILDQRLGDGSGWEVLRLLRDGPRPDMAAIMLTAMPPCPPADWAERRGPAAVLFKPVQIHALLGVIGSVLGLTWLHDERIEAPPPPDEPEPEPATTTAPTPPPADPWPRLAALSALGDVTGLELWLVEQRAAGVITGNRLDQVASCLERFAFDELEQSAVDNIP